MTINDFFFFCRVLMDTTPTTQVPQTHIVTTQTSLPRIVPHHPQVYPLQHINWLYPQMCQQANNRVSISYNYFINMSCWVTTVVYTDSCGLGLLCCQIGQMCRIYLRQSFGQKYWYQPVCFFQPTGKNTKCQSWSSFLVSVTTQCNTKILLKLHSTFLSSLKILLPFKN